MSYVLSRQNVAHTGGYLFLKLEFTPGIEPRGSNPTSDRLAKATPDVKAYSPDYSDTYNNHMARVCRMIDCKAQLNADALACALGIPGDSSGAACHITIAEADLDGTWELPSLAESDCAGELRLELIRYMSCKIFAPQH